jgi:uncharacterized protein RhaS with RHS repeats
MLDGVGRDKILTPRLPRWKHRAITGPVAIPYRHTAPASLSFEYTSWLSRDPIGVMGGINLYGYVGDNPVNDIDPYGKSAREAYFIYCKCKCEKEWRKVKLVVKEKLILADAITPTQSTILINRNDYNKIRNEQNENPNTPANPLTTGDGSWTLLSHMLAHECGHTCQAKVLGPVYLPWAVLNSGIENIIGYDDNMNNLSTPNERNASQNGMFGGFAQ